MSLLPMTLENINKAKNFRYDDIKDTVKKELIEKLVTNLDGFKISYNANIHIYTGSAIEKDDKERVCHLAYENGRFIVKECHDSTHPKSRYYGSLLKELKDKKELTITIIKEKFIVELNDVDDFTNAIKKSVNSIL